MDGEPKILSDEQLVEEAIRTLAGINIPVDLVQQIGIPVSNALVYMRVLLNAIRKPAEDPAEAEEEQADG